MGCWGKFLKKLDVSMSYPYPDKKGIFTLGYFFTRLIEPT